MNHHDEWTCALHHSAKTDVWQLDETVVCHEGTLASWFHADQPLRACWNEIPGRRSATQPLRQISNLGSHVHDDWGNGMDIQSVERAQNARARALATPIEEFDVADPELFRSDTLWPWFERLRREDPVHLCRESRFGPYWSVTKHRDIIAVDSNHRVFSSDSEIGGITIQDGRQPREQSSFIALDPPMHDAQRKVITPMFSPENLAMLTPLIRLRAAQILDELPRGETFDFVD